MSVYSNPDNELYFEHVFCPMDMFAFTNLVDFSARTVQVNTPEAIALLEEMGQIPVSHRVEYTQEGYSKIFDGWMPGVSFHFVTSMPRSAELSTYLFNGLFASRPFPTLFFNYVFLLQGQDDMIWGPPVARAFEDGSVDFKTLIGLSIMRNSANQDVAWDFLRFMMEFEGSVHRSMWTQRDGHLEDNRDSIGFPLNRARFDNQLFDVILDWNQLSITRTDSIHMTIEEAEDEGVPRSVEGFRDLVELVNRENRTDQAAVNDLIYPDIYQFWLGRQDAAATLANIQNRLTLYMSE